MRWRVEFVVYVYGPEPSENYEEPVFDAAFGQVVDDDPDEVWMCPAPVE